MFGLLSGDSLLIGRENPERERAAVPLSTPVSFPDYSIFADGNIIDWTTSHIAHLARGLLAIRRPADITIDLWQQFNVSLEQNCCFEVLIPDHEKYLPPLAWTALRSEQSDIRSLVDPTSKHGEHTGERSNSGLDIFSTRIGELQYDNEIAFQSLTGRPRNEHSHVKISHFRRFWEALENVSTYWDTSRDQYFQPVVRSESFGSNNGSNRTATHDTPSPSSEQPPKKVRMELGLGLSDATTDYPHTPPAIVQAIPYQPSPMHEAETMSSPRSRIPLGTYKGLRIAAGIDMPEHFRIGLIHGFLEPIVWASGWTVQVHRRQPALIINNVNIPQRLSTAVWRRATNRARAKLGWLEGPIIGVTCRPETGFAEGKASSNLDALRELGSLLVLAQERNRSRRLATSSGEDPWWSNAPRWGGGPGGEVGESDTTPEVDSAAPVPSINIVLESIKRRKKMAIDSWKHVRPGLDRWDPRCQYTAIGRDEKASQFDEVFMLSSLNHHVAVLKLRLHTAYLDYLETEQLPSNVDQLDPSWCKPQLQRTKWFDLLDVSQRVEAARGVWGVVAYLARFQ